MKTSKFMALMQIINLIVTKEDWTREKKESEVKFFFKYTGVNASQVQINQLFERKGM